MTHASGAPPAWQAKHSPKPLPFDSGAVRGLSERLLLSHWENNYSGAVRRLNLIEQQLANLPADAPPFLYGALKREELIAANSMVLHELYFANLGGDGIPPESVRGTITATFGDFGRWEREFRGTAAALGGGSGWVMLAYHVQTEQLRNTWASDHTQGLALAAPLLVLDMYEHSYALDYGADAQRYIAAFMDNVDWDEVGRRLVAARTGPPS